MRTTEELIDRLSEDRIWRVKEISTVSNLAGRNRLPSAEVSFYCRAGSALFYAHWEGFVKRAATHYLKYLSNQRIRLDEMADFVMCLYMRQMIGKGDLIQSNQILKVSKQLQFQQDLRPRLVWKNIIDTESNLSSTVLKKIVLLLGLDYNLFATKANLIDSLVVKHRNAIAHGEEGEVDLRKLEEIAELVIYLITLFRDLIENAATLKSFKRVN